MPPTTPLAGDSLVNPTFAPLVPACQANGIPRSTAFDLKKRGLLRTFKIGARTYVDLESLRTLPQRLAQAVS